MGTPNPARPSFYKEIRACDAFLEYLAKKFTDNPTIPNGELAEALAIIWSNAKDD